MDLKESSENEHEIRRWEEKKLHRVKEQLFDGERRELGKLDLLRVDKSSHMPFSSPLLSSTVNDLAVLTGCYRGWKDNKQCRSVSLSKQKERY